MDDGVLEAYRVGIGFETTAKTRRFVGRLLLQEGVEIGFGARNEERAIRLKTR